MQQLPQILLKFALTDFSPFLLFINYQTINKSSDGQQRYLHPITHGTNHKQEAASLMEKPGSGLVGAAGAVS